MTHEAEAEAKEKWKPSSGFEVKAEAEAKRKPFASTSLFGEMHVKNCLSMRRMQSIKK